MSSENVVTESVIPMLMRPWDARLLCPICGDTYVHPAGLSCLPAAGGRGLLQVDSDGIHLDPTTPPQGRGVVMELKFWGECGHTFCYRFQFHKGETFVERATDCEGEPGTIWRD